MNAVAPAFDGLEQTRRVSLRYLNVFRLILAGLFVVAGQELNLGGESPRVFLGAAVVYLTAVLLLGFPDAIQRLGFDRVAALQGVIDIVALAVLMWASGGYRSGVPLLLMTVVLAGSGLVSRERTVLFHAALATVLVLSENTWRFISGGWPADFFQVGIACAGFFAIAVIARLLARRAQANEALARRRGAELASQQAINERIIRDLQDGVIVLDAEGRIRHANARASNLLGIDLPEGALLSELDAFLAARTVERGREDSLTRLGRARRSLRCRTVEAGGDGDTVIYTVIYLSDFEEIQRQIQQLKLAALGRLTASMAHEIRNPLSAVSQAAELLLDENRRDMQARLVRIINDNAGRIERMVRDVLALGRRDEALPDTVPLNEFVGGLVDQLCLGCGEEERRIFQIDIAADVSFSADRTHLQQILVNLLDNARRHCSGAPGSIRIRAETDTPGVVILHVSDDGPGVSEADRAKIFEPFFTSHPKGTGLGLYIARELAEANGAVLELAPGEGGAHFTLTGRSTS
ncbi:PAS domain-containing protein [Pseudothauera nasutitermitis]|uniref:histidine kinase n=1 Tax=Pseudothauera nasutitermitis TaxID=2565930 RepID=A0A4S4AVI9_9RHOO|nr:ATP-binding protein [Pseudothauera nasutitermitis]THF64016.1 PAS domain-containing protein [Pseudothauera nasutitermitis]